jgi:hypothetical protein
LDKFVIRKEPKHTAYGGVRIGYEEYMKLNEISKKSGVSVNRLATMAIAFSLARIEIMDDNAKGDE